MLSAVHAFLLVFPLLQAGGARAQFAVNSDSLEQALPQERGALKRCGHYGGGMSSGASGRFQAPLPERHENEKKAFPAPHRGRRDRSGLPQG